MEQLSRTAFFIIFKIDVSLLVDLQVREVLCYVLAYFGILVDNDSKEISVILVKDGVEDVLEAEIERSLERQTLNHYAKRQFIGVGGDSMLSQCLKIFILLYFMLLSIHSVTQAQVILYHLSAVLPCLIFYEIYALFLKLSPSFQDFLIFIEVLSQLCSLFGSGLKVFGILQGL